jgi:hypothetical protein
MGDNKQAVIHQLKPHYRSGRASLAAEFFSPCLQARSQYRRAAGYFSSSALTTWAAALPRLALSADVSIKVIASPQLTPEDVNVLNSISDPVQRRQYEEMVIERILDDVIRMAESPSDIRLRARVFAWLLVNQRMTIRFAFADHVHNPGIFHEKIGIFVFPWGSTVAFTGSANETISCHERNYESIDVYRSWISGEEDRVKTKAEQFDEAWNNPDPDAAAVALCRAGFQVTRMPEKFRSSLAHPQDYFMETAINASDCEKIVDAIMDEIDAIVDRYGGLCVECGAIPSHYVPFEEIFEPRNH